MAGKFRKNHVAESASTSNVPRREVLKQLAITMTAAGAASVFNHEAARIVHALANEERQENGEYTLKLFTENEFATLSRLTELIVPADANGGSGVDAGAPEFIDLLCSQNNDLADIYRGGLAWLDATMRHLGGTRFIIAAPENQTALLDALVKSEQTSTDGELGPGVQFFRWVRRMTVDAYYTSPIGISDLQYQGNTAMTRFSVPQDTLDFTNREIERM